jgi:putative Ca2+/H+ antiporter (TMEM165/GDT1 family)
LNWRVLWTTFGLIFLAELGDKTQLTTMALAAESKSPRSVFAGAATALVLSSLLGVLLGGVISRYVPPHLIRGGAGALFIIIGILLVSGRF